MSAGIRLHHSDNIAATGVDGKCCRPQRVWKARRTPLLWLAFAVGLDLLPTCLLQGLCTCSPAWPYGFVS